MHSLRSIFSKDKAEENLSAPSKQPDEEIILLPFSGKLNVDEKLKLKNKNFKQKIYDFFKDKDTTPLSQITAIPPFPTPHVMAQFASKAYRDYEKQETDAQYETRLALPDGWKLLTTASNSRKKNGYFGAAYWHPEHQQVVIAHRGTDPKNVGALWTDVVGVLFKHHVPQMGSASTFAHEVVEVLREINQERGVNFQLFSTGHSLGGWLAQITTFTTKYLKTEGNKFLKNNNDNNSFHPHTVVFDSPGCKDMLSQMRDTFDVRLDGRSVDIEHLDITSYLSAPNRINTCNKHLGTVYRIFPDLTDMSWQQQNTPLYNLATHSMVKIVEAFDTQTGQVCKDEQGQLKVQVVVDWPISTGLKGGEEYKKFFEWAEHLNNYHPDIKDKYFQYSPIRYQTKLYDEWVNSLCVFSKEEQEFLQSYLKLRPWPELCKPKELFSAINNDQAQEQAEKVLKNFEIESDTVCCKDATELQDMIPYVKRLLQLFPEIKDIKNTVYQCETWRCVEQIKQGPLEVNCDALNLREFLENEQQQVLQLQMVNGDEWTGLIKVYQVLEKTNFLIEGQYTVLKLERFLSLNMLMDFSALLQSFQAPHLIMVACEANHLLKEETKDMIRTIFETVKRKPFIKIILTTCLKGREVHFLQHISMEIFGNDFVTRDEQLTWHDLTSSSQRKLLEKSVKFQDTDVALNELMSAKSAAAKFLCFDTLLGKKELSIADPVPISNGYNECYYIGRTFHIQKAIKQDIFNDQNVRDSHVYLAGSEQEYQQLCQLHPYSNVHWLEKDNSGKLLWHKSQGSLVSLCRYIDTDSSCTYTNDGLDKLLEQAEHQRVMLISDRAGMGKTTVLTHLSKVMKEKFSAKWVVRIDLNDHTDALKVLKQECINKEKAIEFVSEKLLKLKHGLERELFKQCCEQKQKVRIVIMLDGFDEVSPFYKEIVIQLLQTLRLTAVEQLWVTTRPHLREELEDNLQQLCYTLEPFSEKDQIEFLTKFWSLRDWFTKREGKEEEIKKNKVQICAEHLIKQLENSISDSELTGIPLQTRMLAEAFDKEVKMFYLSAESMPNLEFKLDLLGLYERFIDRKYDIYQEEKGLIILSNPVAIDQRERDLKIMRHDHQLLAMNVLFTANQVALFQNKNQYTFSVEQLTRVGIAHAGHAGKLNFIHRTFAEYYVADCLVNSLTEGNNTSEQVQTFILKDIFLEEQYQVIRAFINALLRRNKPSEEMLKQYGTRIDNLRNDCLLHTAALEGNADILKFLLDSVRAGGLKDTVIRLLLGQDTEGNTAWYWAAGRGKLGVSEIIWDFAKENLTKEEIKCKLLLAKDNEGNTAWQRAAEGGEQEALMKIWDLSKENLTTEEIKNNLLLATDRKGNTAWHLAAKMGKQDVFQKIWDLATHHLTAEELKNKLLLATDSKGNTAWHLAAAYWGKQDLLQKIWDLATDHLTAEEKKNKFLLAADNKGNTAWHFAAFWDKQDILQKIWDLAKETLTTEEIKNKLLLATDNDGNTAWHLAAYCDKPDILQKIWDLAKEDLTTEKIKNKLVLATDNKGYTAWHLAAYWGKPDVLHKIWDLAKESLTTEEIKIKLLLGTDNEGNTAWLLAVAYWGKEDVLQKMWDLAKCYLTTEEMKNKFLLAKDSKGNTIWHLAAFWEKQDVLQKIWDLAKDNLTTEDIKLKLLLATNSKGNTAWHLAAYCGNQDILLKIWDLAKDSLTTEEVKNKLLLATDSKGNTVWHLAANGSEENVFDIIWALAKDSLTTEEIKNKLLLATDRKGNTAWHVAACLGKQDLLQKVWDLAKDNLTTEDIKNRLLLATDSYGNTAWHLAARGDKLDVLQKIWYLVKDNLTKEERKLNLLLATDSEGNTAWHRAAEFGELNVMQKLWDWAKEFLTTEEIKNKLLLATDSFGNNAWQRAAKRGEIDILYKIWVWALDSLTIEDVKYNFLLATDSDGNTAWQFLIKRGELEVLQKIWNWAKDTLTKEEITSNFLLTTDIEGNTAWDIAALSGELDEFQKLWDLDKDSLTTEEIKSKLLAKDSEGNTAWHWAAKWSKLDVLQRIWDLAKGILTKEEIINKLLLATDREGNTAWHWATERGKLDLLHKIWDLAKQNLAKEEIKFKLLLTADRYGNTAWQVAASKGNLDLFENIVDWAEGNLTIEEMKEMLLLSTDSKGNTAWHMAAFWGKIDILHKIWDLAECRLTTDELNELLFASDSTGNTAWDILCADPDLYQKIRDFLEKHLTREMVGSII